MSSTNRTAIISTVLSILAAVVVSGCGGNIAILDPLESEGRITTTAANALFSDRYELIDLVKSLDPEDKRKKAGDADPSKKTSAIEPGEFGEAIRAFYRYDDLEGRRNRLQDELLWRSENRCVIYKNYLKRVESMQGTYTGIISTILGGVGAITKDIGRAQLHSALSAISSGVGAELKQGFFSDVAVAVLVPGIDAKRQKLMAGIQTKRKSSGIGAAGSSVSINAYTMEAALRDVAEYHGACGILAGLDYAKDAIREVQNPGLITMAKAFGTQRLLAKAADPKSTSAEIETARIEASTLMSFTGVSTDDLPHTAQRSLDGSATGAWQQSLNSALAVVSKLDLRVTELKGDKSLKASPDQFVQLAGTVYTKEKNVGCGLTWLRQQVVTEFSEFLPEVLGIDKGISEKQQMLLLATGDEAKTIRERAALAEAVLEAGKAAGKVQRYSSLLAAEGNGASAALGAPANMVDDTVASAVAKIVKRIGEIQLKTGDAPAKTCP